VGEEKARAPVRVEEGSAAEAAAEAEAEAEAEEGADLKERGPRGMLPVGLVMRGSRAMIRGACSRGCSDTVGH